MKIMVFYIDYIYFTKSQLVAMYFKFHQTTDSKKNKFTIIVFESADPYLLDWVELKHTSLLDLRKDRTCYLFKKYWLNIMKKYHMQYFMICHGKILVWTWVGNWQLLKMSMTIYHVNSQYQFKCGCPIWNSNIEWFLMCTAVTCYACF